MTPTKQPDVWLTPSGEPVYVPLREKTAPFVLTCTDCEAGGECASLKDAKAQGWMDIFFDPDGLSWNFLGHCPEHAEKRNRRTRRRPADAGPGLFTPPAPGPPPTEYRTLPT